MAWKIGCCGFPVAQKKYLEFFPVVEIQKTFYYPPGEETMRRWREGTPPEFEYVVKAWQVITHPARSPTYQKAKINVSQEQMNEYGYFRDTQVVWDGWKRTCEAGRILNARVFLFQTPASFQLSAENKESLRRFFTLIDHENFHFVWEPRGNFDLEDVKILCEELDLIPCTDPFVHPVLATHFFYIRLHGREGARYRYTESDFDYLLSVLSQNMPGYIFFNNMHMFEDAVHFKNFVRERGVDAK